MIIDYKRMLELCSDRNIVVFDIDGKDNIISIRLLSLMNTIFKENTNQQHITNYVVFGPLSPESDISVSNMDYDILFTSPGIAIEYIEYYEKVLKGSFPYNRKRNLVIGWNNTLPLCEASVLLGAY